MARAARGGGSGGQLGCGAASHPRGESGGHGYCAGRCALTTSLILSKRLYCVLQDEQAALQRGGMAAPTALSDIESDGEESGDLRWRRIAFASAAPRWVFCAHAIHCGLMSHPLSALLAGWRLVASSHEEWF